MSPTAKVVTCWRVMVLQELFWLVARPLVADDGPSAVMLAGMCTGLSPGTPGGEAATASRTDNPKMDDEPRARTPFDIVQYARRSR